MRTHGKLALGALCVAMFAFAVWTQVASAQITPPSGCNDTYEYCDETTICVSLFFVSSCSTFYYYYPRPSPNYKIKHV